MSRIIAALIAVVTAVSLTAGPAQASNRVTPGSFTGYGFDQCITPDQASMDAWLTSSPYWAVGVYIAGQNRFCGDAKQVNLTAEWVDTQLRRGWRILPITVGPQASCYTNPQKKIRIVANPENDYAAARAQGEAEAHDTVARARALGIAARSTLWYDLEAYDISNRRCRESALFFLSSWTRTLHELGYVSGVYSSAASGIKALDDARVLEPGRFVMPDRVWIAEWVDAARYRRPPTWTPPSLLSAFVRDDGWLPGRRMRQYRGGHPETYGGVTINIDTNYLDLGRGTRAGRAPRFCRGLRVDFPRYRRLVLGQRNAQVAALQCLLRRKKLYDGRITGFYGRRTARAVTRFQRTRDLPESGTASRRTWTVLLVEGSGVRVLKVGSGGDRVRRLQRALNAAIHAELDVSGIFDPATTRAVRAYQGGVGLPRNGVVAETTWAPLRDGLR